MELHVIDTYSCAAQLSSRRHRRCPGRSSVGEGAVPPLRHEPPATAHAQYARRRRVQALEDAAPEPCTWRRRVLHSIATAEPVLPIGSTDRQKLAHKPRPTCSQAATARSARCAQTAACPVITEASYVTNAHILSDAGSWAKRVIRSSHSPLFPARIIRI